MPDRLVVAVFVPFRLMYYESKIIWQNDANNKIKQIDQF